MVSITKYILENTDITTDIFYRKGEEKGKATSKREVVKNPLQQTEFSIEKIAFLADVPVSFVEQVRSELAGKYEIFSSVPRTEISSFFRICFADVN